MDEAVLKKLTTLLGRGGVLTSPLYLSGYSYDAGLDRARPEAVVFPSCADEVASVVKLAAQHGIPITPRGAGTGLSGGSIPTPGGIVICLSRMNRVLKVDWENRYATMEAGVVNQDLQNLLNKKGFFYAPDPSSQAACTLGGNAAENAGGPHCFKYGYTINHVLGLKMVTPEGRVVELGGPWLDSPGYDLVSLLVGSEGMLGLVTEVTVKIMPRPEGIETMLAVFLRSHDAAAAVSDIIASGVIPTTLEMMDKTVMEAVQASLDAGFPADCDAVLLIEVDGFQEGLERQVALVESACRKHHLKEFKRAKSESEREKLWAGRKGAAAAVARIAPNQVTQDGSVPPTRLPELLERIEAIGKRHGLLMGNVMHAGDGNLHPIMLFDERDQEQVKKVHAASKEILQACVAAGGTISGEHGIGLEKKEYMPLLFSQEEIEVMQRVKASWDPGFIFNPDKVFPWRLSGI